jgi:hypothetical protein
MANYTGSCLCGAIKYEVNGEPVRTAVCHCDDCRKATGSSYATNFFFKEEDIVVTEGTPKEFQHKSDAGNTMTKQFCGDCGSQLFGIGSGSPGVKHIKAGTLDNVGDLKPAISVFTARKHPFTVLDPDIEQFETMRPQ